MQPGAGIDASGRIVVFGGYIFSDHFPFFVPRTGGFLYDTVSGEGDGIANLNVARAFFAFATDAQHRFYVIGGLDAARNVTNTVERYDPGANMWTFLTSLPEPRENAGAVYDGNGHVLVIGGANLTGTPQSTVFSYDIATEEWSTIASQPAPRQGQAAVLGADGLVYVVGGSTGSSETTSVYIYDPGTGLWSTGPNLITARSNAAIALGDDDYIYAMGGLAGVLGTDTVERLYTGTLDSNGNGIPDACEECGGDPDCDDGVDCTDDFCDGGACVFTPNDANCPDDGLFCNGTEFCDAALDCSSTGDPCKPGLLCNETTTTCERLFGDGDGDGDLDLEDCAIMVDCFAGPDATPNPTQRITAQDCLDAFDADADDDVDLFDFASLQVVFVE
ncbi:MAG: hypothetical protein JSU86_10385 [Phycisphaerales bacterium]|nr:MAG: hypothetical protein JSU86_10385 [Phycisphaerales bacterium]